MPGIPSQNTIFSGALLIAGLLATGIVYGPGLSGGFVFDDFHNIVSNEALRASTFAPDDLLRAALSSDSGPLARPLAMLSFALQVAASGLSPYSLKTVNLAIHLVNGVLVFVLMHQVLDVLQSRRPAGLLQRMEAAFPSVVAAAWLLAPINLTAVLYVVQRMESLSTMLSLLGLIAYMRGRARLDAGQRLGLGWIWGGLLVGTALASLAKETGLLLPAYTFVLEWVLFGLRVSGGKRPDTRLVVLFSGVLFIPGLLGIFATLPAAISGTSYAGRPFTLVERLLTEARAVTDYLRWMTVPNLQDLGLHHDDYAISRGWFAPASTLPAIMLLAGLAALALWLKGRRPLVSLGILLFLIGHSLVSTYLPLELVYEHRNYLPSVGVFVAIYSCLLLERHNGPWRAAGITFAAGLIFVSGFTTYLRAREWADSGRLAYIEATRHPESPRANYELGRVFAGRVVDANGFDFSMAEKSFKAAAELPNPGLLPFQGLIAIKAKHGKPIEPELWQSMKHVITSGPIAKQDVSALQGLVICRSEGDCLFEAEQLGEVLKLAVSVNSDRADLHTIYSYFALYVAQDTRLALALMLRASALEPHSPLYWENLIFLHTALGRLEEADVGIGFLRDIDRFGTMKKKIEKMEAVIRERRASSFR